MMIYMIRVNQLITLSHFLQIQKMGQNQAGAFQEGSQLMSQYRINKREPQLAQTYLTHKTNDHQYLLKEFTFSELRQFSITNDKIKNRKTLNNPHLTLLKEHQQRTEDSMCSDFYKVYTLWEYPHKSIAEDLAQRKLYKNYYINQELQQFFETTVQAMKTLQQKQIKHQCLTLHSLRADKKGGLKLSDPLICELPNFDTVFNNRKVKNVYLSPEQCWSIRNQKPIQNKNCYKNDVFTMGMILLQCGLLQTQENCYQEGYTDLKWGEINNSLFTFGKIYGDETLKRVVEKMLEPQISNRPDWLILSRIIGGKYQEVKMQTANLTETKEIIPRKTQTLLNSQLPTIKSVQSQGTYSHSLSSRQSFPIEHIINRVQDNRISRPQPAPVSPQTVISPVKIQPTIFAHPQQPAEVNRITFNSPQKRQISFNFVSSPFRNTVPSPPPQPPTQVIRRSPIQPISTNVYSQPLRNTTPPKVNFGPAFAQRTSMDIRQEHIPLTLRQNKKQSPPLPVQPIQSKVPVQEGIENPRFTFQKSPSQIKNEPAKKDERQEMQFVQEFFKMGSRYEGYKLNGMRHGQGKFYYQDGGFYDGEWKENQMNGHGTLYYQSNTKAYEGEWVKDEFHGYGTLYNQTPQKLTECFDYRNFDEIGEYWIQYEGNFNKDAKEGEGTLKFSNGEEFKGHFKDDMVQGQGFFTTKNNVKIHGLWNENQLVKLFN